MVSDGWTETQVDDQLRAFIGPTMKVYRKRLSRSETLNVFAGREPDGTFHMSISHQRNGAPGRLPTYEELKTARYRFCPPEAQMAMFFPPESEFVNIHETTLHLYEVITV